MRDCDAHGVAGRRAGLRRGLDALLRVLGGVFAVLMAMGSAVVAAAATQLWVGIPVVGTVVFNVFLVWFAQSTMERSWAWLVPGLAWLIMMIPMVATTPSGDRLTHGEGGLFVLAAGIATFMLAPRRLRHAQNGYLSQGNSRIGAEE